MCYDIKDITNEAMVKSCLKTEKSTETEMYVFLARSIGPNYEGKRINGEIKLS